VQKKKEKNKTTQTMPPKAPRKIVKQAEARDNEASLTAKAAEVATLIPHQ